MITVLLNTKQFNHDTVRVRLSHSQFQVIHVKWKGTLTTGTETSNVTLSSVHKMEPSLQHTHISVQPHQIQLEKRFPNSIIIGVKKSGTRALINMLDAHPRLQKRDQEIQFFSMYYAKGLKWYTDQMPHPNSNKSLILMETSTTYFTSIEAPKRIYHDQPKPTKLMMIVRNPIARLISDYVHESIKFPHGQFPTFEETVMKNGQVNVNAYLGMVNTSLYDIHFQHWLEWFNRSEILVIDGDQLIETPLLVLKEAEKFLECESFFKKSMFYPNPRKPSFYCLRVNNVPHCLGSDKGRPHPEVDKNVTAMLHQFYSPHMKKFCALASVNFSWCNL